LEELLSRSVNVWLLLLLVPLTVSIYIHSPDTPLPIDNFGLKYSDIVHGVFGNVFTVPYWWFSLEKYSLFKDGVYRCPAPYLDYKFEYPPLVGLFWYVTTCTSFMVAGDVESARSVNYYLQSAIIAAFYVLLVVSLAKLARLCNRSLARLAALLLPSTFIYSVYNWDVICASLAVLGVLYAMKRRDFLAGLLLGLSVSAKVLTAGIAYYYGVKLLVEGGRGSWRRPVLYVLGLLVGGVLPFIVVYLASPTGFSEFIWHHVGWYCENCLYLPFIRDIWSELHRRLYFSIAVILAIAFPALLPPWRGIGAESELRYLFAAVSSLILFNYVFPPQMLLLIAPFAALSLGPWLLLTYGVADLANAMIILTFFNYPEPWAFGSVPQYAATIRNFTLLALFIYVAASVVKERPCHGSILSMKTDTAEPGFAALNVNRAHNGGLRGGLCLYPYSRPRP